MDIQTARDNIGKEVVLNEDTKPYYGISKYNDSATELIEREEILFIDGFSDEKEYVVVNGFAIHPRHLELATPTLQEMDELEEPQEPLPTSKLDNNELRLEIFRIAGHSNSLWELQEIEAWLLNK